MASVDFSDTLVIGISATALFDLRVIKTLRHWGVYVDEVFFLGGVEKSKVLKALKPQFFLMIKIYI